MRRIALLLVLVLLFQAWRDWSRREIVHPPGAVVKQQPVQSDLTAPVVFPFKGFRLKQRARFEIRARVLSTKPYRWGTEAQLSSMDLALGWGAMSDQGVLDRIEVTQANRWYFTRYEGTAPLPEDQIIRQSGNMHIIPQERRIENEVEALRKGDIVNLGGFLVDVEGDSGFRWNTSMTRKDTGNGSCEIFFVESIQTEQRK